MAVQNQLAKKQTRLSMTAYLSQDAVKDQINKVVGGRDGQRFITAIVSAVTVNPALSECSNASILSAALLGESLKLSPSPQLGHYYMLPFDDKKKGMVAVFVLGYKGMIQLAIRSGQYKKINVLAIKEGELDFFDPLNEDIKVSLMIDKWDEREAAETIGYYAMFELNNGFRKSMYWSKAQMEKHAEKYSPGYRAKKGFTFWEKDFDAMAYKTMLRQLIGKWGIMSIEMQRAFDDDMTFEASDGSRSYVETEEYAAEYTTAEVEPKKASKTQSEAVEAVVEAAQAQQPAPASESVQAALFG